MSNPANRPEMAPDEVLRHVATELTALAFQQPDGSAVGPKLMGLVQQLDDTRVAMCTCGQPWKGTPQPHAAHCALVSPPFLRRMMEARSGDDDSGAPKGGDLFARNSGPHSPRHRIALIIQEHQPTGRHDGIRGECACGVMARDVLEHAIDLLLDVVRPYATE